MKAHNALPQVVFPLPCISPSFLQSVSLQASTLVLTGSHQKTKHPGLSQLYRKLLNRTHPHVLVHSSWYPVGKASCLLGFPFLFSSMLLRQGPLCLEKQLKQLPRAPWPLGGTQAHALYAERMELLTSALSILGIIEHLTVQCGLQRVYSILSVRSRNG